MKNMEQWKSRTFIFVLSFIAIFVNASHTHWLPPLPPSEGRNEAVRLPEKSPNEPRPSSVNATPAREQFPVYSSTSRQGVQALQMTVSEPQIRVVTEPVSFVEFNPGPMREPKPIYDGENSVRHEKPPGLAHNPSTNASMAAHTNLIAKANPRENREEELHEAVLRPRSEEHMATTETHQNIAPSPAEAPALPKEKSHSGFFQKFVSRVKTIPHPTLQIEHQTSGAHQSPQNAGSANSSSPTYAQTNSNTSYRPPPSHEGGNHASSSGRGK